MAAILSCPVCNRAPKIKHRDQIGEHVVTIICKPLFGKLHEEALAYSTCAHYAYIDAIELWNARVKNYKEAHKDVST